MPSWGIEPLVELLSHLPDRYSLSFLNWLIYSHRMRPIIKTFSLNSLKVLMSFKGGQLKKLCGSIRGDECLYRPFGKLDCLYPKKKNVFS